MGAEIIQGGGLMERLKCGQFGDRPGLLVTVTDRAADTSIDMRYECYKMYARAIERALKAEALARELMYALKQYEKWENATLAKARRLLGDMDA
jgi:hypothetical protein